MSEKLFMLQDANGSRVAITDIEASAKLASRKYTRIVNTATLCVIQSFIPTSILERNPFERYGGGRLRHPFGG